MANAPRDSGLRLAPAWSPPGRFWLAWPLPTGDREQDEAAREDCLGLAELLSEYAPVSLICPYRDVAECALRTPPGVAALGAEYDGAVGLRDLAPLWLLDGEGRLAAAVVRSALSRAMAETACVPAIEAPPGLVLMLETDGEGTALVPGEEDGAAGRLLSGWLGLERLVWLTPPPAGPNLGVRFLAPGLVAVTVEKDERHANHAQRAANRDILAATEDAHGRRLSVLELPSAKRKEGSYADCLLAGERVVVPEFEDGRGGDAFALVSGALPYRKVTAFPSTWIAPHGAGLGAAVAVQPA